MEDCREFFMTAAITGTTASSHLSFPFTLFPPSLSSILTPSFSPSVHFPCFFHVLGIPVSLHRMPRLQHRLPSRRLDLNIDDDKCPNLSRAISISRAEGEGVGWASDVCVNITFHCVPFIYSVYHLHGVPCFVREQHGIQKNTAEKHCPIAFADRIRPDLAIGSRTHRGRHVNKCRGDRRSWKSRASERANCDNLNLRGRNKVSLCSVLMLMNYPRWSYHWLSARSLPHRTFQFLLLYRCPDPCCQSQSSRAWRCRGKSLTLEPIQNRHTVVSDRRIIDSGPAWNGVPGHMENLRPLNAMRGRSFIPWLFRLQTGLPDQTSCIPESVSRRSKDGPKGPKQCRLQ